MMTVQFFSFLLFSFFPTCNPIVVCPVPPLIRLGVQGDYGGRFCCCQVPASKHRARQLLQEKLPGGNEEPAEHSTSEHSLSDWCWRMGRSRTLHRDRVLRARHAAR